MEPRRRPLRLLLLVIPALALYLVATSGTVAAEPSPATGPAASAGPDASAEPTADPSLRTAPPLPKPIAHRSSGTTNTCAECHARVNDKQAEIVAIFNESIHGKGGVSCAGCHGGDPTSDKITVSMSPSEGYIGIPSREETVGLCGSCHSDVERMKPYRLPTDQYAKYFSSVHGQRLVIAKDQNVAICVDCHGSHDTKKASDPTADVYPLNVPNLCATCHSDPVRMEAYGIPTNQYEVYEQSVHGKALLGQLDVRAPSCASCHGSHDAKPPRSSEVVDVCGRCHTATQALYMESRHAELDTASPKCWTCHGTHDVSPPGQQLFFHPESPDYQCATCHDSVTQELRLELDRFKAETDRRCDTCHHPNSFIYSQVEGIAGALEQAQAAYDHALERIEDAKRLGMIVEDAEVGLSQAKTSLIQAQAAVHTTKLTVVAGFTDEAQAKAHDAQLVAQAKIDESVFRRQAMGVVLGLILLNVGVLGAIKRRLDRDLEGRGT
jgi:hypothetical protein